MFDTLHKQDAADVKDENRTEAQAAAEEAQAAQAGTDAAAAPEAEAEGAETAKETAGQGEAEAGQEPDDAQALQEKLNAMAAQAKVKDEKIAEMEKRLLRLQADFENFRRRTANEKAELSTYVTMDVVAKFLKILDNFERAEASAETAQDIKSVTDGMSAIMKQFQKTLDDLGVKEIPAEGQKFDPKYHEAVMRGQNPDLEEDTIDAVFEKGYELNDKVIRHSKVRVISND